MQIANVEALKEWLAKTMGPICDADPTTLAKYVIALLKKEKSEQELHLICTNELEAFLNTKTTEFVELLFATLKDGSYAELGAKELPQTVKELSVDVPPVVSSAGRTDVENSRSQDTKVLARANVSAVGTSSRGSRRDSLRGNGPRSKSRDRILPGRLGSGSRSHRTSRNEEDRRTRVSKAYSRRSRNQSRSRSRDRGWERRIPISRRLGNRSDLRERVDSLRGRNGQHSRDDRSYRRTSRPRRAHSRSRSRTRSRSRAKSPPRVYSHMRAYSRSRSRTLSRSRSLSPLPTPSSPNAAWSSKRVSRSRSSEGRDENTYRIKMPLDVVLSSSSAAAIERANMLKGSLPDLSKPPPSKARCRDYDEQGLCLLGNLCPYDHGIDPVIVEDVNLPVPASLITFPGGQPAPVCARAPVRHSLAPLPPVVLTGPEIPLVAATGVPLISSGASAMGPLQSIPASDMLPTSVVADPTYSSVKSLQSTKVHADASLPPTLNRVERYIVPVYPRNPLDGKRVVVSARRDFNLTHVNLNQPRFPEIPDARYIIAQAGRSLDQNMASKQFPFGRTHVFDPSHLGIRQSTVVTSKDSATLELAGIPTHLNTISSINQELSKYGTIVNIQVYYNGLADRALVAFAQNAEAAAAIHSSEPVFNNRFVTLSWHSTVKEVAVPEARKLSVKERLGTRPAEAAVGVNRVHQPFSSETSPDAAGDNNLHEKSEKKVITVSPSGALTRTVFTKQLSNNNKATESKPVVEVEPQSNHKDLRKEQLKVRLEIDKQKQLIMKKHVEKQKALLLRLENHDLSAEERKSIIETMKVLEGQVQRMSAELNNSTVVLQPLVKKLPDKSFKSVANQFPQEQPKSRAEIRKSILDTELDLIAKENQGSDTSDLKKKLAILKSQAASQGLLESRRGFRQPSRGRGGSFSGRGRGRRGPLASATKLIDRRPKQLLVSGFAPAVVDQVVAVASRFSGVENTKYLSESNCLLVTFHSRHDAEKAAIEGLRFQDQILLMSWFDSRKSTKQIKKEEESAIDVAEGESDVGENANATEAEKKFSLEEDSESEVELIVEDDDYKEEELSNSVTIGFDEDMLDESELLRLDEDDDNDVNLPQEMWQR